MKSKLPLTATIALSVGFHAVVGALLAFRPPFEALDEVSQPRAASVELVEPDPEPVAFVLLDDSASFSVPVLEAAPTVDAMDRKRPAIAAVAPHAGTAAVTHTPVGPEASPNTDRKPNSMFQMRDPNRDKGVAVFALRDIVKRDAIERPPAGTTPVEEVPETGKLQPSGGGTHRSNEGVFTARVEKDGSVNLKDSKNFNFKFWPDPRKIPKIPKMIASGVANWYTQEDKTPQDPEREPLNNKRPVDKDTKPDHGKVTTVPIVGGSFDITDALMRRKKVDPYASKKLAYLDSTRDERVQIGNRYRKSQLAQSGELMQKQLDLLLSSNATVLAKKQVLFELWEDCAETGEGAVVEGGRQARALVIGFINAKFPKGSANAFTTNELATLNQKRKAKTAFEPYR